MVLTLWGDNAVSRATELEGREGVVMQITACRVTDFNGAPRLSTLWVYHGSSVCFRPWLQPALIRCLIPQLWLLLFVLQFGPG